MSNNLANVGNARTTQVRPNQLRSNDPVPTRHGIRGQSLRQIPTTDALPSDNVELTQTIAKTRTLSTRSAADEERRQGYVAIPKQIVQVQDRVHTYIKDLAAAHGLGNHQNLANMRAKVAAILENE